MDLNFSQGKVFKSVTVKRVNDMQTGQTDVTCLDALCMWGGCNKLARGCKTRGQGCFDLVEADKDYYVGILDVSYWSLCNDFEDYYSCSLWVKLQSFTTKTQVWAIWTVFQCWVTVSVKD